MSAPVLVAGDVATLTNTFSVAGTATDPTTVSLTLTDPTGAATTYTYAATTITRTGTGAYTKDVTVTEGQWSYTWVGTGTATDTATGSFYVASATVPGIVSLQDVQAGLANTNTDDDETLRALILMASDICEQRTRLWRRQTITTTYDGGTPKLQLRSPIISVTTATENGTTITNTGYTLDPVRGWLWRGGPTTPQDWAWGRQNITITYVAGAPNGIIPEPIRRGCTELVRYQFNQQRGGGLPRNAGYDGVIDPGSGWLIPRPVQQLWQPYAAVLVA